MPQDELTVVVEYDTVAVQIDEAVAPIGVTLISNMGPPGPPGADGDPGPAGPTGATGPKGDTGDTGPQGPQGVKGDTGDTGPAGADGTDGATWYSGSGAPASGLGIIDDWYFDIATGDVYLKTGSSTWSFEINLVGPQGPQGVKGDTGPAGPTGPKGDKGDTGDTGPAGADGSDGAPGATGATGPAGADGVNGSTWYSGSGAPSSGTGVNGDYYFRTSTGDVYLKSAGSWGSPIANLTGPTGATGATGSTGATGAAGTNGSTWYSGSGAPSSGTGVNGDYYFRTSTGDVYLKVSGSWGSPIANLTGPAGSGASADGWIDDSAETWTYASGSGGGTATFTVSGDKTEKYTVGTRIKLTQTTVKYFVVAADSVYSSGNTTVTITAGSDYTLANAAITNNYHSYVVNPQGYPGCFNYTITYTGFSSNPSTIEAKFSVIGKMCTVQVATGNGTSNSGTFNISAPIPSKSGIDVRINGQGADNGVDQNTPIMIRLAGSTSTINVFLNGNFAGFNSSGIKSAFFTITYPI